MTATSDTRAPAVVPPRIAAGRLARALAAAVFAWGGLGVPAAMAAMAAPAAPADLRRLVVIGDSLAAGYQNASLSGRQQTKGFASRLARRAGVALPVPLIDAPGIPNALVLVSAGPPPVILPARGLSTGRSDSSLQAWNLAVPGARVADALDDRPDLPIDSMTDLVLGFPGLLQGVSRSQLEWAEAIHPTTTIVWIGSNDVLRAALDGDPSLATPPEAFDASYRELAERLAATGSTLVFANIPDVTAVPFLIGAGEIADRLSVPVEALGPLLGIGPGDFVTPRAAKPILEIFTGQRRGPLPGDVVLDADEVATLRARTAAFNAVIAREARDTGAALVDVAALIARIDADGVRIGRRRITTRFLGGFFSLDGVHPCATGHAILTNEFIRAIDERFGNTIPPASLESVAANDPLVLRESRRPPGAFGAISDATVAALLAWSLR